MKKNKGRNHQKKRQQKAQKASFKKKMERRTKAAVLKYIKGSMRAGKQTEEPQEETPGLDLEGTISFAKCEGVGECCKNRPIFIEPTDIYRIMHNERAKKKFGLEVTMDLYGNDEKPGPLVYQVEKQSLTPFCAIHRVELPKIVPKSLKNPGVGVEERDQVCPFFEFKKDGTPECILGDDRFTQCSSDPVSRTSRISHKRRLAAWEYALMDNPCLECRQASEDEERTETVRNWLKSNGMEERYIESDLFHGLIEKLKGLIKPKKGQEEFLWKMATTLMFDWDLFAIDYLQQPKKEVLEHGPSSPKEVYLAVDKMMEGIINGPTEQRSESKGNKKQKDESKGQPKES